jgi:carbonic anhydrase
MNNLVNNCCAKYPISRRSLLQSLFTGIAVSPFLFFSQKANAQNHQAKALVLSCIDFRFIHAEQTFLTETLAGQYDWTALAGASLALTGFPHPAEAITFWDQLELSSQLHHIEKVIILDHQDCGAYASFLDADLSQDPTREYQVHQHYLRQAYEAIHHRYPQLEIELYFVRLTSEFQRISPQ